MKGLSIALRIIAILGAAAAAFFWVQTKGKVQEKEEQVQKLTTQKQDIESELDGVMAEKTLLEGQKNSLDLELSEAKSKVKYGNEQLSRLKSDIQRAKKEQSDLEATLAEKVADFDKLKKDYIDTIENRPPDAPVATVPTEGLNDLQAQINTLSQEIKDKDAEIEDLKFKLTAFGGQNPVADENATTGVPRLAGTQDASILRTDPDKGILIISRGQVDGLQKQMQFNVVKGLDRKVSVKVGTVAPTYSVAYILPGEDPSHLQQGDSIKISE